MKGLDDFIMGTYDPNAPFNQDDSLFEAIAEEWTQEQWEEIEEWYNSIEGVGVVDKVTYKLESIEEMAALI